MDRREALKKLAAGGAVAAGASVVLTSNGVAFAASLGDTGLIEGTIPGPNDPIEVIVDESAGSGNSDKEFSITNAETPACASGQPVTTYQWQIVSFTNGRKNQPTSLVLTLAGGQTLSSSGGATGFTSPSVTASSGTFGRADGKPMKDDSYVAQLRVSWRCTGSSARVEALYQFTVVKTVGSQQTLEWNVI